MGQVHLARDVLLDRPVAVKLMQQKLGDASFLDRFRREARLAAQLNHPHIATVYEFGTADGEAFLAMEYVDGKTLEAWIAEGPLDVDLVRRWGAQAASALAVAHDRGIVHRDIKAANLMITAEGSLKVMDFGVARSTTETALTMEGALVGTANIMAPEIVQGRQAGPPSDLFSLGCVLYEALAGARAFPGQDVMAVLFQVVNGKPTPIREHRPDLPDDLVALLEGLLVKDPEARFGPARAVAEVLEGKRPARAETPADATLVADRPAVAGSPPARETQTPREEPKRSRRWLWGSVAAVAVAASIWALARDRGSPSGQGGGAVDSLAMMFTRNAIQKWDVFRGDRALATPERVAEVRGLLVDATKADPSYRDSWNTLAALFVQTGDLELAERYARDGLRNQPDNSVLWGHFADVLAALEKASEAEDAYEKAVSLDPETVNYRNGYGRFLIEQGRPAEAESVLRDALGKFPDVPQLEKNLALALLEQKKLDEADRLLEAITTENNEYWEAWALWGRVAEERRDFATARTRWVKLVFSRDPLLGAEAKEAGLRIDSLEAASN